MQYVINVNMRSLMQLVAVMAGASSSNSWHKYEMNWTNRN